MLDKYGGGPGSVLLLISPIPIRLSSIRKPKPKTSSPPAAHQRIRAATDLLETFSCLTFEHADLKDISHLTNALYLLVQDGCDLLEAAQHVQLQPAQPQI